MTATLLPLWEALIELGATSPEKSKHVSEIADALGLDQAQTNSRLCALHDRGWAHRPLKGHYWTEDQ